MSEVKFNIQNEFNASYKDEDWGTILINKTMEELLDSIRFNKVILLGSDKMNKEQLKFRN